MSSVTAKRTATSSPKTGHLVSKPLNVAPPKSKRIRPYSALFLNAIERATDLGDGYVLVKIHDEDTKQFSNKTPVVKEKLPRVTVTEMLVLYDKLINLGRPAKERPPIRQRARRTLPENESFMKILASEGMADRQNNLKKGLLLTSGELCDRLQFTRQALSKAVKEFRLFALEGPSGNLLYPAFFTSPVASRRKLEKVSQALGDLPGASKWQFFTTPKASLQGKTPVEALAKGEIDNVLRAAAGFKER